MKTSYFSHVAHHPVSGVISIARMAPPGFQGPTYLALAPSWELFHWYKNALKEGTPSPIVLEKEYTIRYQDETLRHLSIKRVEEELIVLAAGHEPVLLCWEGRGKFCHRRLAAAWLAPAVGAVSELV